MQWGTNIVIHLRALRFLSRYPVTSGMISDCVTQLDVSIHVYFALGGIGARRYAETKYK